MSRMRNLSLIEDRRRYVKKIVSKSPKHGEAVRKIAKKLFVSIATIYNDLAS